MDHFYLKNATLYKKLVAAANVSEPAPHFSRHKAGPSERIVISKQHRPDIVTAARVRPMLANDDESAFPRAVYPVQTQPGGPHTVSLHDLYNHPRGRPVLKSFTYELDRLFDDNCTTEALYTELLADLVIFAQQGGIGTLFAYGQTGSGKTFTISNLQKLAAKSLASDDALDRQHVFVTIVELAGNSAFDLLNSRKPVAILQDSDGATHLAGAVERQVSSANNMRSLIDEAASYRRTAPTKKNDTSSRSHSICRVRMHGKDAHNERDGLLFLVDLAGSEAARDVSQHGAEQLRETKEINISLSVLKDCIRGKSESDRIGQRKLKAAPRIPVRQSTLTRVLKHVFDPSSDQLCKTAFLACLNPSLADVSSSKNTLRYAEMLRAPISTGL